MQDNNENHSHQKLFEALAKAQKNFKPAELDRVNPHFKSKYASLASVQEVYRDALSDNGLCIIQNVIFKDNSYYLQSILAHSSGQSIQNEFKLLVTGGNMQSLGSAITYAKRYSISALIGIVADEDDDGNASLPPDNNTQKPKFTQPPPKPIQKAIEKPLVPKPIPNMAPQQPPTTEFDEFDQMMDEKSPLDLLVEFVAEYNIPHSAVSDNIERITGQKLKASQLNTKEIDDLMSFLSMKYV